MVVVCLNVFILHLNIVLRILYGIGTAYDLTVKYKNKMFKDSHILNIKYNVGPKRCAFDCTRHAGCNAVNYRIDKLFCELLKSSPGDRLVALAPYSFSEKKDWTIPDDACTWEKCRDGTLCVITKKGLPLCVKTHFNVSDVAFGKYASQSSTFANLNAYAASQALDGDNETSTVTTLEYNPYWLVHLERIFTITSINVINRGRCECGNRLHDLDIHVGTTLYNMELCDHYKGPGTDGEYLTFKCYLTGRYVRLSILGTEYLSLAEVKVMAIV